MQNIRRFYPFLDGMRGAAVLWVAFHHIYAIFEVRMPWPIFNKFLNLGFLGVDVFFVISGFLITGLLLPDFAEKIDIKRFYMRRFFKIIPQYYFAVIVALAIFYGNPMFENLKSAYPSRLIFSYFVFLQNYLPNINLLGHTWSLAIEEHFYFVYPLLLAAAFSSWSDAEERRRMMTWICCILIIAFNVFRFWIFQDFPEKNYFLSSFEHQTFIRFDALLFGCLLKFQEPYLMKLSRHKFLPWLFGAVGGSILLFFILDNFYIDDWYAFTLAYFAAGCFLVAGLLNGAGIFNNKMLQWVGKSSYGIYLWHYILIWFFYPLLVMSKNPIWIFIYLATAILVGWLSTITIERWFLNLRRKIVP